MGAIIKNEAKQRAISYLKDHLDTTSRRELARRLGIGKTTVNRWATELGHHPKKYAVNENFFDEWSEKSAYILGFIFADGNVAWNTKKSYWTLTITASEKDKAHLEKIRELMKSTKPLRYSKKTKSYRLTATNRPLCKKLMRLGVIPRKSLKVKFPHIPKHYLKAFIRGVVDGDGNVRYVERDRSPYFEITIASGSEKFCKGLRNAIKENFGIPANIRRVKGHNTLIIQYSCNRGKKLAETIYAGATIFLGRKYAAYEQCKTKERINYGE